MPSMFRTTNFYIAAALGTEILLITVTDEDHLRANTDTKFSIKDGIAGSSFVIETEDNIGILKVKKVRK